MSFLGGIAKVIMGGGGGADETYTSRTVQKIYNQAYVDFATRCDSNVGNSITINVSGDNNVITNLILRQDITYTFECVQDQFNERTFYNDLGSRLVDLANTGQRSIDLFGLFSFPVPNLFTDVTVNTEQIQESTNSMYAIFNQTCAVDADNSVTFNVEGDVNLLDDIEIEQNLELMANCQLSATNQEQVTNKLLTEVLGASEPSLGTFGYIALFVILIIVLLIIAAVVVAIVRASRGNKSNMKSDSGAYDGTYDGAYDGKEYDLGYDQMGSSSDMYGQSEAGAQGYGSDPYSAYGSAQA